MKRNRVFLTICIIILVIGMSTLIRSEKPKSEIEQRALTHFPHFTIGSFLDSSFQNNFNLAMSDQFVLSETIKTKTGSFTSPFKYKNIDKTICKNRYVKISNAYSVFNCDDRIVFNYYPYNKNTEDKIISKMKNIEKLDIDVYFYYINNPITFNFIDNKQIYDFSKYFKSNFRQLAFKNYEEFKKYFYKTDHHWNYRGQYVGYKDIINMLLGDKEEILKPKTLKNFHVDMLGSLARLNKISYFHEDFKANLFEIDKHYEYVNGIKQNYGKYKEYLDGKIDNHEYVSHYGEYYGESQPEVIYDFYNNKDKENLLIVGNSHKNAILPLIASHFHKTYVVDSRYYPEYFGREFVYEDYIKQNNIDKVLVIGDSSFYGDADLGIVKGDE